MTESKPTIQIFRRKGEPYTCAGLYWKYVNVNNYNKAKKNGNKTERAFDAHKDS